MSGLAVFAATGAAARPDPSESTATYVGADRCAQCHERFHTTWKTGRHSKMVQPATREAVRGDFTKSDVELRGRHYSFRSKDGQFYITEAYLTGAPKERKIAYTLGNRRIQHYITTLDDGRMVVLPPSWDITRKEWFHNLEIVEPEETDEVRVQVWNSNCFGCHVSRQEKNFDPVSKTYATRWQDFGTNCERCHGPASRHVDKYAGVDPTPPPGSLIVRPTRLSAERNSMVCAQCHSFRDVTTPGFVAGDDYYDHFTPILEYAQKMGTHDPVYWADGRPRRFSNDALGLWQSECFLKGNVACTNCHHEPHEPDVEKNPQLAPTNDALCVKCHDAIGKDKARHTRHAPESPGSSCVECHMPRTVFSIKASMRDHTISVPTPENTVRFGIPNACTECHKDKKPEWAAEAVKVWGPGSGRRRLVARAEAFSAARKGEPAALDKLIAIAASPDAGPVARANAVGYLRRYSTSSAVEAVAASMKADHPLVRAVAVLTWGDTTKDPNLARPPLVEALSDSHRIVRVGAAFALVSAGVTKLEGEDGRRLEEAKRDYVSRAELLGDDPETRLNVGKFYFLDRDYASAERMFRGALDLRPKIAGGHYLLGLARIGLGDAGDARKQLGLVPKNDPFFAPAQQMLARLGAKQ